MKTFLLTAGILLGGMMIQAQSPKVNEKEALEEIGQCFEAWAQAEDSLDARQVGPMRFIRAEDQVVPKGYELQQIFLFRHGHPAVPMEEKGGFKRTDAIAYVTAYDTVGVYPLEKPRMDLAAGEIPYVLCSAMERSRHTAELMFGDRVELKPDSVFREFERQIAALPNLKMPLNYWRRGSAGLWVMGFNHGQIESFRQAKQRAKKVSSMLIEDAQTHSKTVLVAHGGLNHFLIRNLKKEGWHLAHKGGFDYAAVNVMVRLVPLETSSPVLEEQMGK